MSWAMCVSVRFHVIYEYSGTAGTPFRTTTNKWVQQPGGTVWSHRRRLGHTQIVSLNIYSFSVCTTEYFPYLLQVILRVILSVPTFLCKILQLTDVSVHITSHHMALPAAQTTRVCQVDGSIGHLHCSPSLSILYYCCMHRRSAARNRSSRLRNRKYQRHHPLFVVLASCGTNIFLNGFHLLRKSKEEEFRGFFPQKV